MKSVFTFIVTLLLAVNVYAKEDPRSKTIADAVKAFSALAEGVQEFKIKPTKNIKEAMKQLALQERDESAEEFDESWTGEDSDAWGADSSAWGSASMKGAYNYIVKFNFMEERFQGFDDPENELRKLQPKLAAARAAFKNLLGTGVMFGIAPMGAIQCGVTFAALAVVDPYTGKVTLISMEGSGC